VELLEVELALDVYNPSFEELKLYFRLSLKIENQS
jgi:hypothetical protein